MSKKREPEELDLNLQKNLANNENIVLDTNILISSIDRDSQSRSVYNYTRDNYNLVYSRETLAELEEVLSRDKIVNAFGEENIKSFLETFKRDATCIDVVHELRNDLVKDIDDKKFIELAMSADADYVISGDEKHLQPIKHYQNVQIFSPSTFLQYELDNQRYHPNDLDPGITLTTAYIDEKQAATETIEWEQLRAERLAMMENSDPLERGSEQVLIGALIVDKEERGQKQEETKGRESETQINYAKEPERTSDDAEQARKEKEATTEMTDYQQLRVARLAMMENTERNTTGNLDQSRGDFERENDRERET